MFRTILMMQRSKLLGKYQLPKCLLLSAKQSIILNIKEMSRKQSHVLSPAMPEVVYKIAKKFVMIAAQSN